MIEYLIGIRFIGIFFIFKMVEAGTGTSIGFDSNVNNGGVNNNEGNFNSGNRIKRTLSAVPSLYGKYKDSNGFIFRKRLRYIEDKISPIIKTLIPNFLVAHHVYVAVSYTHLTLPTICSV